MSYDSRCYDLAEVFLSDEPEHNTHAKRDYLAQVIQNAIEDSIEFFKAPVSPREQGLK